MWQWFCGKRGAARTRCICISDLRLSGNSAWLVTGKDSLSVKVYQCPINQQPGDLETCVNAGEVEGVRNFGIALG